jgi:serine/threonine protein kinase
METFLALDRSSMEEVALRVLRKRFSDSQKQDFCEAVEKAKAVDHPHVARLRRGELTDFGALVSWQWIPGVDLRGLIRSHGLRAKVSLGLLGHILQGLGALHLQGVTHGDLHPGNVRVTPGGKAVLVGHVPCPQPASRFEEEDRVLRYSAPEWYAEGTLSPPSDVYSLGLVLYELFSGHPPIPAASARKSHLNQVKLNAVLEKGVSVNKAIPKELLLVLRNLLQVEIRQRWQSGNEVLEALEAILSDETSLYQASPLIPQHLNACLRQHTRSLLRATRNALAAEVPLSAASCLHRLGVFFDGSDFELRVEASEQLRRTLWFTFRRSAGQTESEAETTRRQALALQLTRAAQDLGATDLLRIVRMRLGATSKPGGPLGHLLPLPEDSATRRQHRRKLLREISRHPADDLKLLELACYTPKFHTTDATPMTEMRVDLLMQHRLYAAALYHRSACLADNGEDPMLLESLRDLLDRALDQITQGMESAASSPEEHPTFLPPPSQEEPTPLLRELLWTQLVPGTQSDLTQLERLLLSPEGEALPPWCISAVSARLPAKLRSRWGQYLLEEDPESILGHRDAWRLAQEAGDSEGEARHLLALGKRALREGALPYSLDLFRKARKILPEDPQVVSCLEQADHTAKQHREAAKALNGLKAHFEEDSHSQEFLPALEGLQESFPGYLPAQALLAETSEEAGETVRAAQLHEQLATVAFLVERRELARSHLVKLLRCDPENDDVLLALALLASDLPSGTPDELRTQVRQRMGLPVLQDASA